MLWKDSITLPRAALSRAFALELINRGMPCLIEAKVIPLEVIFSKNRSLLILIAVFESLVVATVD